MISCGENHTAALTNKGTIKASAPPPTNPPIAPVPSPMSDNFHQSCFQFELILIQVRKNNS